MSTAFDLVSLDLVCALDVHALKLGSGELTNQPLLTEVARRGLPVLCSTGMGTRSGGRRRGWLAGGRARAAADALRVELSGSGRPGQPAGPDEHAAPVRGAGRLVRPHRRHGHGGRLRGARGCGAGEARDARPLATRAGPRGERGSGRVRGLRPGRPRRARRARRRREATGGGRGRHRAAGPAQLARGARSPRRRPARGRPTWRCCGRLTASRPRTTSSGAGWPARWPRDRRCSRTTSRPADERPRGGLRCDPGRPVPVGAGAASAGRGAGPRRDPAGLGHPRQPGVRRPVGRPRPRRRDRRGSGRRPGVERLPGPGRRRRADRRRRWRGAGPDPAGRLHRPRRPLGAPVRRAADGPVRSAPGASARRRGHRGGDRRPGPARGQQAGRPALRQHRAGRGPAAAARRAGRPGRRHGGTGPGPGRRSRGGRRRPAGRDPRPCRWSARWLW